MISKLFQSVIFLLLLQLPCVQSRSLQSMPVSLSVIPLHEVFISVGAVALLILGIIIYRQNRLEERRIQFTVFNSQYIGKESTRSTSQHDFPNFDGEVANEQEQGGQSSQRRRRRRKADRLERGARMSETKFTNEVKLSVSGTDGQEAE